MKQERWEQIDSMVAAALELPEAERETYVIAECADDKELQNQVLRLIEADKVSDKFMRDSAMNLMAKVVADDSTMLDDQFLNKTIGSYKITRLIGTGGMGEVYLARDEKLNRDVAIKVLPPEFHADDERLKRFSTEARAIAALNHPNIVTIYDFENAEGINYIATEYVKGRTIRELINGGMPVKKALPIILQALDALSVAHDAGIIHRDIKPENIMVREDGYVKILDFGLVKLTEGDLGNFEMYAKTMKNAVIGTPAYMSPIQASGETVDHRTDVWSLGLVFYEMLTGRNPFKRDNKRLTIQAILSTDPPQLSSTESGIPPEIETILDKALEKDVDLGYQTSSDFAADLKRVRREFDSSASWDSYPAYESGVMTKGKRRLGSYIVGILAIVLSGIGIWYFVFQNEGRNGVRWEKAKVIQLTEQVGKEFYPSLSPDGKTFVYASNENGNFDIYSRRVGSKRSINLTPESKATDTQPTISPNGNLVAFRSRREPLGIYVMNITGENQRRITDFGFHPSWSPDGTQLIVSASGGERPSVRDANALWIINIASGEKRKLIGNFATQPSWSPNGKRIAFWFIRGGGRRDIATISAEGGEPAEVTNSASTDWNPVWSPDGRYLYFASDRRGSMAFWRVPIDQSTGEILGEPEIVPSPSKFNSHLSFSRDGKRLIYVETNNQANIRAIKYDKKTGNVIGDPFWITQGELEFNHARISPDGQHFVAVQAKPTQDDIALFDLDGKNRRDLTNDQHFDRYPRWSPDGKDIVFTSDRTGIYEIWTKRVGGTNLSQITFNNRSASSFPVWSPDGKKIVYSLDGRSYIVDVAQGQKKQMPTKLPLRNDVSYMVWDWSPDGDKLLGRYRSKISDERGIGYYSLETNQYVKLTDGIRGVPSWMPNSVDLVSAFDGKIYTTNIKTKKTRELLSFPGEAISSAGINPKRNLLYFIVATSESNIWLLDNTESK